MSDCSILCCGPAEATATATRTANPTIRDLDGCNNQTQYFGVAGDYAFGTPVKFNVAEGTVEPALDGLGAVDGVDAIGVSVCIKTIGAGDVSPANLVVVARTGRISWQDIAVGLGELTTDQAAWWAIHQELAKANIYVSFN